MSNYKYTFSVFTPTYNRAYTLPRVYQSLKAQTYKDFEWLIVDDGSTDDTAKLVKQWHGEADFAIKYIWQENAGKHMAVNRGVQEAQGKLFLFLDSDDACVPEALERFKYHWDAIPAEQKHQFSAVTSLAQYPNGNLIGTKFPFNPTDSNSLEIRFKYKVKGEKWGFHRTDILKKFPNPGFLGEKSLPESLLWNRIAIKYKTRYINEPLEIYYLTPNSWGANSHKIRARCPKGTRFFYMEFIHLDYPIPKSHLLRAYANYIRFSYHAGLGAAAQLHDIPSLLSWIAAFPIGFLAFIRDKFLIWLR